MRRINYLLSSVAIVGLFGVLLRLRQSDAESMQFSFVLQCGLIVLAVAWLRLLERRLADAGLPRWAFWPYFLSVFAVCFAAHARQITNGPRTLALFLVLQIPAILLESKPAAGEALPGAARTAVHGYPGWLRPAGRFLFLLRVLLMGVFADSFYHLAHRAGHGVARWEIGLALVLVCLAWIYNVQARALDSRLPGWIPAFYCLAAPGMCVLPVLLHLGGLRTALALFLVLQIATVYLPSQSVLTGHPSPAGKQLRQLEPLGALDFAVYILLIAGLWLVLHLLRGDADGGYGSLAIDLVLDAGSLSLLLAWVVILMKRLKGLGLNRWSIDICSIVFILSLAPFAFRVMAFPRALILFVALQIPVVFARRVWIPARLIPAGSDA